MKVFKGLPIIARVNNKNYDIANSEMFTVKEFDNKKNEVIITDDENEKVIPLDQMTKLFYLAYCVTVHKYQGSTIDKPFTIYEWTKMEKKLKYTAVTRSTKFAHFVTCYVVSVLPSLNTLLLPHPFPPSHKTPSGARHLGA